LSMGSLSGAAAIGGGATGASFLASGLSGRPIIGEPGGKGAAAGAGAAAGGAGLWAKASKAATPAQLTKIEAAAIAARLERHLLINLSPLLCYARRSVVWAERLGNWPRA